MILHVCPRYVPLCLSSFGWTLWGSTARWVFTTSTGRLGALEKVLSLYIVHNPASCVFVHVAFQDGWVFLNRGSWFARQRPGACQHSALWLLWQRSKAGDVQRAPSGLVWGLGSWGRKERKNEIEKGREREREIWWDDVYMYYIHI